MAKSSPDTLPVVGRIGRAATPGEHAVQLAQEDTEFLSTLAYNLFESFAGLLPEDAASAWDSMAVSLRKDWENRVMVMLRAGTENETEMPAKSTPPRGGPPQRRFRLG